MNTCGYHRSAYAVQLYRMQNAQPGWAPQALPYLFEAERCNSVGYHLVFFRFQAADAYTA